MHCSVLKVCGIYYPKPLEIFVEGGKSMIQKLTEINGRLSIKFNGLSSKLFVVTG